MADSKVAFELVAPERLLASIDADMVVIPGAEGDFGVLPDHAPLMSLLRPGVIAVYQGDKVDRRLFVAGGFAEVNEKGCTVLAERAEPLEEIPLEAARQDLRDAEEDVGGAKSDPERERLSRRSGRPCPGRGGAEPLRRRERGPPIAKRLFSSARAGNRAIAIAQVGADHSEAVPRQHERLARMAGMSIATAPDALKRRRSRKLPHRAALRPRACRVP